MGKKSGIYIYFTEGETEEEIITILKKEGLIYPGKISVFNLLQNPISKARIRSISNGTTVLIVFDTDIQDQSKIEQLNENIKMLSRVKEIKEIILIPQNRNLEEELLSSTRITSIKELLGSKSDKDFKRDIRTCSNIFKRLESNGFDETIFWRRTLNSNCKFEQYMSGLSLPKVKRYR